MSGPIYGNMLGFFPELMKRYQIFSMRSKVGAGYGERVPYRTVTGYFLHSGADPYKVVSGLLTENDVAQFFVRQRFPEKDIRQGLFVEVDELLYRFKQDDGSFTIEAGYAHYVLQLVPGNTDAQTPHENVNLDNRNLFR